MKQMMIWQKFCCMSVVLTLYFQETPYGVLR